jgi:murein DD-endopeptidase MepM/ murein hydrolase activator NlpD
VIRALLVSALMLFGVAHVRADVSLELFGQAVEGGLMFGKTEPGAQVSLDQQSVDVSAKGYFLISFGRDAAGEKILSIKVSDRAYQKPIIVADRDFKIERIDGLPQRKVTPDPKAIARIGKEKKAINAARKETSDQPFYLSGFQWPATGRISGVYGSQRILNGKPRRPHYGTDIAAPTGTPIRAVAPGRVVFVHKGMFFNGKTVLIDHGLGLRSIYIHLSETFVEAGQLVDLNTMLGAIGQTGRATGPHLHFGMTHGTTPVDPEVVLGPMPN